MGTRSWEIVGVLGEGGFGRVFEGIEHDRTGPARRVALKVLHEDPPPADVLERLRTESRLLRLVGDRAFVRADEPLRIGGRWAVVLEHVEGVPLGRLTKGGVPPRAALEIVAECARALHAVGSRRGLDGRPLGLVHRDLTPANLLVTATGEVRIVDLGLGRAAIERGLVTRTGVVPGTHPYVAPERFFGGAEGPPVDIFALGVVLAGMVEPPPSERTITSASAPLPVDAEVLALAQAMRAHDPADRPPAREVERRCAALAARVAGPSLREWAEEVVPPRLELGSDDPWVGLRIQADRSPVRRRFPIGLAAAAVALIAVAFAGAEPTTSRFSQGSESAPPGLTPPVPPTGAQGAPPPNGASDPTNVASRGASGPQEDAASAEVGSGGLEALASHRPELLTADPSEPLTADPHVPLAPDPLDPLTGNAAEPPAADPREPLAPDPRAPLVVDPPEPPAPDPQVTSSPPIAAAASGSAEGAPRPGGAKAPAPEPPPPEPVLVWVRSKPWGQVTVPGQGHWRTEQRILLPPGRHTMEFESYDGQRKTWEVDVVSEGDNGFCWEFEGSAPCSD